MDEPTIGLDPHQIQGIRKLINNLRGKHTVIISSHILPEIERCCDRMIIINRGRVVASGTSEELREEFLPGSRYTIEVSGDHSAVAFSLEKAGIESEPIEPEETNPNGITRLHITLEIEENIGGQLIEILSKQEDFRLIGIYRDEPNLEEIFLAATKRSWEETIEQKSNVEEEKKLTPPPESSAS